MAGSQLECPTCFRKLVVPQTGGDSKLILSATQVSQPRSWIGRATASARGGKHPALLGSLIATGAICLVLTGAATYWLWKHPRPTPPELAKPVIAEPTKFPRLGWTLELTNALLPDKPAAGRIAGKNFTTERATFRGSVLSLREGRGWPPEAAVSIALFSDKVGGKTLEVTSDRPPPAPRVTLRWKDGESRPTNQTFHSGYALRIVFAQPTNGIISGKLFLAVPDDRHSYVAGTFNAEVVSPGSRNRRAGTNAPPQEVERE